MSQDRRLHRRERVGELQGILQFSRPAQILDLSRTGAAVETPERLVPGRSYSLGLHSPGLAITPMTARVVWCKLTGRRDAGAGESTPVYRAGLQFEQALAAPASDLLDHVVQVATAGVDTRLLARHKMSDLASTLLLRGRATFDVRILSRGGLGAEMEYSPRIGSMLEFVLQLDQPVELKGRVANVTPAAEEPRRYLVGIEFVGLGSIAQGQLDRYLDGLRSSESEPESG